MAKYTVTYERDEAGWWIAEVHGVTGVNRTGAPLPTHAAGCERRWRSRWAMRRPKPRSSSMT